MPPLYSTITLLAEVAITTIIFYTIRRGYYRGDFLAQLAGAALAYEVLFNISYMVARVIAHGQTPSVDSPFEIGLAIVHGALSLVMFISLIIFFTFAWKRYKEHINFFKDHKTLTILFLGFWMLSVLSGVLFYFVEYFG